MNKILIEHIKIRQGKRINFLGNTICYQISTLLSLFKCAIIKVSKLSSLETSRQEVLRSKEHSSKLFLVIENKKWPVFPATIDKTKRVCLKVIVTKTERKFIKIIELKFNLK